MGLSLVELDSRLDALLLKEREATSDVQERFQERFFLGWLYHELSIEGEVVSEETLTRALAGEDGSSFVEGQVNATVRRFRDALLAVRDGAFQQLAFSTELLDQWQNKVLEPGSKYAGRRTKSGSSEAYKHDVIEPGQIDEALAALLESIREKKESTHPFELAAHVHFELTQIWPWNRHNAFIARMCANAILLAGGYPPIVIHAANRQRYYHALHYNVSRLAELLLECLDEQLRLEERFFRA